MDRHSKGVCERGIGGGAAFWFFRYWRFSDRKMAGKEDEFNDD